MATSPGEQQSYIPSNQYAAAQTVPPTPRSSFGASLATTRGQAFTMIARRLGLARPGDSVEVAAQKLADAGIIKATGSNPNDLGLNDPLKHDDVSLSAVSEQEALAAEDPALAAYLAGAGLKRADIEDEIGLRRELFTEDSRRRSASYEDRYQEAAKGIDSDFENRGLYRSGVRLNKQAETGADFGTRLSDANYNASREYMEFLRNQDSDWRQLDQGSANATESSRYGRALEAAYGAGDNIADYEGEFTYDPGSAAGWSGQNYG